MPPWALERTAGAGESLLGSPLVRLLPSLLPALRGFLLLGFLLLRGMPRVAARERPLREY